MHAPTGAVGRGLAPAVRFVQIVRSLGRMRASAPTKLRFTVGFVQNLTSLGRVWKVSSAGSVALLHTSVYRGLHRRPAPRPYGLCISVILEKIERCCGRFAKRPYGGFSTYAVSFFAGRYNLCTRHSPFLHLYSTSANHIHHTDKSLYLFHRYTDNPFQNSPEKWTHCFHFSPISPL